ncbi:MAG: hypothetical protein ACRDFW_13295 [bacterium]
MKRTAYWVSAAALAAAAPLAMAVEHAAAAVPSFGSVDKDADGYITVQEASTVPEVRAMFGSADKDGDRRLSSDEYTAARGSGAKETEEEG